ncbi:MAG: FkbM family methyltransferase [Caulobacteraceae bacterium]
MRSKPMHAALERMLVAYARRFPISRGKLRVVNALWSLAAAGDYERMATTIYGGMRIPCDLREMLQRQYYFFGTYFVEALNLRAWSAEARSAEVVFDVGANGGIYSLAALAARPDAAVHAFEPTPEIAARLHKVREINGLDGLTVHEAAVASWNGVAGLRRCDFNEGMNFTTSDARGTGDADLTEATPVRAVRLDHVCAEGGIERIDLLKLDIQGNEPDALEGAGEMIGEGRIRTIFMELNWGWAADCPATRAVQRLDDAGYRFSPPGRELRWAKAGDWLKRHGDIVCRAAD